MSRANSSSGVGQALGFGYANPKTFRNERFAELTQNWIDSKQGTSDDKVAETMRDLRMTRARPPSVPTRSTLK